MKMPLVSAPAVLAVMLTGVTMVAAAPATTNANANVRSGAGTNFPVVVTLARGTRIEVGNCRSGWCQLTGNGPRGYISRSLLQLQDEKPQVTVNRMQPEPTKPADRTNVAPNQGPHT